MKTVKKQGYQWALALCLAAGVNSAQAAISNGASTAGGSSQDGELFLNVWDALAQTSYALDLGTTLNTMVAGQNLNHTWNLDQTFVSWAAKTNDALTFNVAGDNSYVGKTSAFDAVMMSSQTGYTNTTNVNMTSIATLQNNVAARAIAINVAAGDSVTPNYAANLSEVTTTKLDQSYFGYATWGTTMGNVGYVGSASVRNGTTPDQALDLLYIHAPGGPVLQSTKAIVDKLNGYLTLNVSSATMTWHSNVATVPLPGTVWLFLSGLLAALGFHKRKLSDLAA